MPLDTLVADGRVTFETAAAHACSKVPLVDPDHSADEVRRQLVGKSFESVTLIVVCVDRTVLGVVRIEDLISAPAEKKMRELMEHPAPVVAPGVDQEVAAWHAVRNQESALVVVDRDEKFVGVIPPSRLLAVLLSEHEEDLSRVGGFTKSTRKARVTSIEPVERRFRHRIPWLLVGLGGALLAADFVGWFEAALHHKVMLAFFIPGIVYLADAVGTQTETVVVRGLSVGVNMRQMVARELITGLAIGVALAAVAGPIVWWRWGEANVAVCVALAVFGACSTATVAAMTLPWLLSSFGLDPAFGSGPLATVIQDLLSILIYFAIATAIVR